MKKFSKCRNCRRLHCFYGLVVGLLVLLFSLFLIHKTYRSAYWSAYHHGSVFARLDNLEDDETVVLLVSLLYADAVSFLSDYPGFLRSWCRPRRTSEVRDEAFEKEAITSAEKAFKGAGMRFDRDHESVVQELFVNSSLHH